MENTAKLGLFAVHNIISEYTVRIYVYMEKTQRDTEPRISRLIAAQYEIFFRSLLFNQGGLDLAKKLFPATVPLNV